MRRVLCIALFVLFAAAPLYATHTTVTIGGSEQFALPSTWDGGTFSLTVNGHTETIGYGQFSTVQSVASGLAAKFSLDCTSPVVAKANGAVITFTTKRPDETFEQISAASVWNTVAFTKASFGLPQIQPTTAGLTPSLSLACTPNPVPVGGSADCTAQLPQGVTGTVSFSIDGQSSWSSADVDANGWAPASTLSGLQPGNHTLSASYSGNGTYNATSQTTSVQVETGALATTGVYNYSITQPGSTDSAYAANGNILAYTDSVNGQWSQLQYDNLNRLTGGSVTPVSGAAQNWCWTYDSFGNRTLEASSPTAFGAGCSNTGAANTNWATYNANNQITGTPTLPAGLTYDPSGSGNVLNDGTNTYLYDGDGRVCAVATRPFSGGVQMTQYIYDAEGSRVAKGTISTFSCDITSNGFTTTNSYVLGPSGEQVTEMTVVAGQSVWAHTNVYAGGMLLATYDPQGLHFQIADWLGSRRVQTNAFGQVEETCANAPFGNGLNCTYPSGAPTTADDATEHHFTGKERDSESGLDYFGARYYGSNIGRFLSPDWSSVVSPVPYGRLTNPQSLNLYAYVYNDPLRVMDVDGHSAETDAAEEAYEGWLADQRQSAAQSDGNAQQQSNSTRVGFWHHVSNLLHGHLWNWQPPTIVTSAKIVPESVHEPNDGVGLVADVAGLVAAIPGVPAAVAFPLGGAASTVSVTNDSSKLNAGINTTSQVLGGVSALGEGTVAGSAASGAGLGVAIGALAWDLDNAFVNHVLTPMFGQANFNSNAPPSTCNPYDYDPDIP